jgi:TonB family protein
MLRLALGIGIALSAGSALGAALMHHAPPGVGWVEPANLDPDSQLYLIPPGVPDGDEPSKSTGPKDQKIAEILDRAEEADVKGDFPAAIAAIGQAIALDPKNAYLLAARGYVRLQARDIAGATRDIEAAAKIDPADTTVRSAQATLDLANGQSQDAMNIVTDLVRENPDAVQFLELRARVHAIQQNTAQALADLGEALRLEPGYTGLHFERALILSSIYDWKGALEDVDQFLAQAPDSLPGRNIRAFALSGLGRREEALSEFDKVIAVQPTAQAYYGRAWARMPGNLNQVMADLDTAVKMDPNLGAAYRLKGQLYFDEANFPAAIPALGNSVRLMPGDVSGARKLAASYAGVRQYDAAIHQLDQTALNHPDVTVLMDRCRYKALKKASLDDTIADCDRAAQLDPMSDEVREARAFAYQRFGQSDKAMETYKDILTRRPNSAIVHFARAILELELHSAEQAKADFVAARKEDPTIDQRVLHYLKAPEGYEASNPEMKALLAAAKDMSATDSSGPHGGGLHSKWRPASIVTPRYPAAAEDDQVQGYVDFEFVVEPDGSVGDPRVTTEMPEAYGLADAAVKVFPQWKFTPVSVNGATVPTKAYYRFSFRLH